jgi:hypothetical protein
MASTVWNAGRRPWRPGSRATTRDCDRHRLSFGDDLPNRTILDSRRMVSPGGECGDHRIRVAAVVRAQDPGGSLLRHAIRVDDEPQLGGMAAVARRPGWPGERTGAPRHIGRLGVHCALAIQRRAGDERGIAVPQPASATGAGPPTNHAGGADRGARQHEQEVRPRCGRSPPRAIAATECPRRHLRCFFTYSVKPSNPVPNNVRPPGSGVVVVVATAAAAAPLPPE